MESKPLPDQNDKDESRRFIEPQPLREEQIQNAVTFLAHPNVRGSSPVDKRSFLERKGLTREEIDEAFRRVPDSPSEAGNAVASVQGSEKQLRTPVTSKVSAALPASQQDSGQLVVLNNHVHSNKFRWTQVFLTIGVITTAGAGATVLAKSYILPKFKAWLRHLVFEDDEPRIKTTEPDPMKEIVSAAAAAATAAAAAAREMVIVTKDVLLTQSEDHRYLENMMKSLEGQTQELKLTLSSMREAFLNIEKSMHQSVLSNVPVDNSESIGKANHSYRGLESMQQTTEDRRLQNGAVPGSVHNKTDSSGLVRPLSAPPGTAPSISTPHSHSYMEIVAMLQRGEKPPNIKDVNDKPPNPNQSPSNPKLQPRVKPWEIPGESSTSKVPLSVSKPVVDNEKMTSTNNFGNGFEKTAMFVETLVASSSSDPWWRPNSEQTYAPSWPTESNVRITELEPEGEATVNGVYKQEVQPSSSAPTFISGVAERGQGWAPPPVPQPVLPGAAAAIRQQKVLVNTTSSTTQLGTVLGQPSSSYSESNPTLPFSIDKTQSEEVQETRDGQDLNSMSESAAEKPSYKDVVVHGGIP